jgi:hypothetical protein
MAGVTGQIKSPSRINRRFQLSLTQNKILHLKRIPIGSTGFGEFFLMVLVGPNSLLR